MPAYSLKNKLALFFYADIEGQPIKLQHAKQIHKKTLSSQVCGPQSCEP